MVQIYREANRVADLLVSKDHLIPLGITVFCDPPPKLRAILAEHVCNAAFPRVVS